MEWIGEVDGFSKLGREIKVGPKSLVRIMKVDYGLRCDRRSVVVEVGIGIHKALVVMSVDAWRALRDNESIVIETEQQHKLKVC